jgi:flavin-dependent dehydrogenase
MNFDVAVIGGGPAGSTLGCLLKKYDPAISVAIFERERFPRDHVGESQLPTVSQILYEMGCWDKVEAANFPIKIGATYCWGKTGELWDFDFMPVQFALDLKRPGTFSGPRTHLAFQVERSIYDKILLDHASELGCQVFQESRVVKVRASGDRVTALEVEGIGEVTADAYVDASGHAGLLRRALGVEIDTQSTLQNVAVWDYWRNAEWADEIGWIWFIPLGADRTSVGLVVPKEHLKSSNVSLPELYAKAIGEHPRIASLMRNAVSENRLETTKDWSFLARRHSGENWFLVGESSGFADPILAAGLTMTHAAGREAAFTILEQRQGGDSVKLRKAYDERQARRIKSHIRFADYWYTANAQFTDLKEFTGQIARENGLDLSPEKAWAWLAQGGFIDEDLGAGVATFGLSALRDLGEYLGNTQGPLNIESTNRYSLNLEGAVEETRMSYRRGRVRELRCFTRAGKVWPLEGRFAIWHQLLGAELPSPQSTHKADSGDSVRTANCKLPSVNSPSQHLELELRAAAEKLYPRDPRSQGQEVYQLKVALEALIADGWIIASVDRNAPMMAPGRGAKTIHDHVEIKTSPAAGQSKPRTEFTRSVADLASAMPIDPAIECALVEPGHL